LGPFELLLARQRESVKRQNIIAKVEGISAFKFAAEAGSSQQSKKRVPISE
jgi:hypothetical protein